MIAICFVKARPVAPDAIRYMASSGPGTAAMLSMSAAPKPSAKPTGFTSAGESVRRGETSSSAAATINATPEAAWA